VSDGEIFDAVTAIAPRTGVLDSTELPAFEEALRSYRNAKEESAGCDRQEAGKTVETHPRSDSASSPANPVSLTRALLIGAIFCALVVLAALAA
jgi:hypothetical protein